MLELLYPGFRVKVHRVLTDMESYNRLPMRPQETLRSLKIQQEYWEKGRELKNGIWVIKDVTQIVTRNKPGLSWHHYGLACDNVFAGAFKKDPYLEEFKKAKDSRFNEMWFAYGKVVETHGCRWGGRFKTIFDAPHMQMTFGFTIQEIMDLHATGGLRAVWTALDKHRGVTVGDGWDKSLNMDEL